MIIKHTTIKEEAAVTCLKYTISKYTLIVFGIPFSLGFKVPPSNIFTFLHVNFHLSKYIKRSVLGLAENFIIIITSLNLHI